jgi:excisionase family DNA binding protein
MELLRIKEASKILGVSRHTIYRLIEGGHLEKVTLPRGGIRVTKKSLETMIEDSRVHNNKESNGEITTALLVVKN